MVVSGTCSAGIERCWYLVRVQQALSNGGFWYVLFIRHWAMVVSGTCCSAGIEQWWFLVRVVQQALSNGGFWYVLFIRHWVMVVSGTCCTAGTKQWWFLVRVVQQALNNGGFWYELLSRNWAMVVSGTCVQNLAGVSDDMSNLQTCDLLKFSKVKTRFRENTQCRSGKKSA